MTDFLFEQSLEGEATKALTLYSDDYILWPNPLRGQRFLGTVKKKHIALDFFSGIIFCSCTLFSLLEMMAVEIYSINN